MLTRNKFLHLLLAATIVSVPLLASPSVSLAAKTKQAIATSPYICTPSGFGHKARCYLRSA